MKVHVAAGSEAGERRSERGDTAYSPRAPRGGAFGHRRTNHKPRNRACREKACNLSPRERAFLFLAGLKLGDS